MADHILGENEDLRSTWQRIADRVGVLSAFSASAILHVVLIFVVFANIAFRHFDKEKVEAQIEASLTTPVTVEVLSQPEVQAEDLGEVIMKSPVLTPSEVRSDTLPLANPSFLSVAAGPATEAPAGYEGPGMLDVISIRGPGRAVGGGGGGGGGGDLSVGAVDVPFVRVGFHGSYPEITRHATDQIVAASKGNKGVVILWLVDSSISMRDDAQAIAQRVWDVFTGIRAADLPVRMGVVYYGEEPKFWVQLTDDIDHTMRALVAVPTDKSGTENVMKALDYCIDRFPSGSGLRRYICVLTDERGDDADRVESVLDRLRRESVTVYVMGRESFLLYGGGAHEQYFDEQSREMRTGVTDRGLPTPLPERAYIWPWWSYLPSGFGPYALSRVAVYTGGSYYMLKAKVVEAADRPKPTPKSAAAPSRVNLEEGFDPKTMQFYRPDLGSLKGYEARIKNDKVYTALQRILDRWEDKKNWYRGYFEKGELDTLVGRCDELGDYMEALIKDFDKGLVPTAQLQKMEERRWVAHYDLARASTSFAAWNFFQMKLRFIQAKGERFPYRLLKLAGPRPDPVSDTKGIENRLRQRLFEHCQFVIDRHPGTPWAYAAQVILDSPASYLRSWSIDEYIPPDPTKPPPSVPPI